MIALKMLSGAILGGLFGVLLGKTRLCRAGVCNVKANMAASIIACAVLGAAVAYALSSR